jgi:hypothetical protein
MTKTPTSGSVLVTPRVGEAIVLTDVRVAPNKDIVGVHASGGLVVIGWSDLPKCNPAWVEDITSL